MNASQDLDDLLKWAQVNGTLLDSSIQIYVDEVTGLSFRANGLIPKGTKLVDCSYKTSMSWLNAVDANQSFPRHSSDGFPVEFLDILSEDNPNVIGHFFLVQQYLEREKSFWWEYIRLLPQPHELSIPILWPEHDQAFLNGTNAEPAIQKRKQLWEVEWTQGIHILQRSPGDWSDFTLKLYQWAAAIYGSRSFRPSLTVATEVINTTHTSEVKGLIREHVQNDIFSILFPVLDIGNHNGKNDVQWLKGVTSFNLLNNAQILPGSQIYNYYGDKSNSELLVAYGFMLPDTDTDRVNLKLIPSPEIQQLRRSQASHVLPVTNRPEEEYMFNIGTNDKQATPILKFFSSGLFDTTTCMLANSRERQWITEHLEYSPEQDSSVFHGPLARSSLAAIIVLKDKLEQELERLHNSDPGEARNPNQSTAINYRNRQATILRSALSTISTYASCSNPLTLSEAFSWLRRHYPQISLGVESAIAEDQEESVPIDWSVLIPDWNQAYFILFVSIVLNLVERYGLQFKEQHPHLSSWIDVVREDNRSHEFYGERDEQETIDVALDAMLKSEGHGPSRDPRNRNMASWIVREESVRCVPAGENKEQDVLCVYAD